MGEAKTKKGGKKAPSRDEVVLKLRSDPRTEKRFEPKSSPSAILSVLAFSVAAVLVGAGTYGQWLRDEALGPHKAAPYLLAAGAAVLLVTALFGPRPAQTIRVGDAGVGVEKGANEIERIAWHAVRRIVLGDRTLTVEGEGTSIMISLAALPEAAGKVLREARERIPAKMEDIKAGALENGSEGAAETLPLEPAQVAGLKCKASGKLIAFERDARLCGRCGEVYHKDAVPKRCATCDARLK
ncbi:hypothetical protein [Polyangium sp. 15x6]|uniref:hypothetical protein n=1 Tax=Polyangium sp. 15x6 TaxID=3042687 RepID=UPI00249CEC2D|nr:hypothetical protein [Polyangium sp. 15x6]MDI3290856.1 hypothetical protein [Polyangium sp. 15x6]